MYFLVIMHGKDDYLEANLHGMSDDNFDYARVVRKLLDNVNHEIIKLFEKNQQALFVGELKSDLMKIGIKISKPSLDRRLKEFEEFGWIKRPMHASHEHTKWEPYSSTFYQKLLAHRETIKMTLANVREEIDIAKILPEAEKLEIDFVLAIRDNDENKVPKIETRMREVVAKLLERFDKLSGSSKKFTFKLAYMCKYFENLPYG